MKIALRFILYNSIYVFEEKNLMCFPSNSLQASNVSGEIVTSSLLTTWVRPFPPSCKSITTANKKPGEDTKHKAKQRKGVKECRVYA